MYLHKNAMFHEIGDNNNTLFEEFFLSKAFYLIIHSIILSDFIAEKITQIFCAYDWPF